MLNMPIRLGLLANNSHIVDYQTKGDVQIVQAMAGGATKRACKRGARKEVSKYISIPNQEIINETRLSSPQFGSVWLFSFSEKR